MRPGLHPFHILVAFVASWLNREGTVVIDYLHEENRVLRARLKGRRLRLTDAERRRLARKGRPLGLKLLRRYATLVSPETILVWHRRLVARAWTFPQRRPGRPGVGEEIERLVLRMAQDCPTWGYKRVQGALKHLGHVVAANTVKAILKRHGFDPAPERGRKTSWKVFLKAHWHAIVAADFFTTDVWTATGLKRFYSLFVIDLSTRRVRILGTTAKPDAAFVAQAVESFVAADDGFLVGKKFVICDRDTKFAGFDEPLKAAGI